jgi:hypothetical protein
MHTTQAMYKHQNADALLLNNFCRGQATSIKYYECVSVALVIQHAMHMHNIYCHLVSLALPYFSTLSHKGRDIRGKNF